MAKTQQRFHLSAPAPYHFAATVGDHGWVALAPCRWNEEAGRLERVERLQDGRVLLLMLQAGQAETGPGVQVDIEAAAPLADADLAALRAGVGWMLKLNEDLSDFYARAAAHHNGIWQTVRSGRGRLLRSPTLWEDVVKTICTTNITWSQTKSMIQRLVDVLGDPLPADRQQRHAFPTPAQVVDAGATRFAAEVRMGYRNGYVLQLAHEIESGARDLEALRGAGLSLSSMRKELLSIKGIGDYAAHTLLAILGYYGDIAVDTEYRNFVTATHFDGQRRPDKDLATFYDDWGDWKYLAYWFDATCRYEAARSAPTGAPA